MAATKGSKIIYLYRRAGQEASEDAWNVAYTTENEKSVSVDSDSTITKDGSIRVPQAPEIEITGTSLLKTGDERADELEDACINNELFQIWEADLSRPSTTEGKFKGRYYEGYMTEFSKSSNAEDYVEISLTFGINGKGTEINDVSVDQTIIDDASYVFKDTTHTGA